MTELRMRFDNTPVSPEVQRYNRDIQNAERRKAELERRRDLIAQAPPGGLTEEIVIDDAGRRIKRFWGEPEACWGMFKMPGKRVRGFNTNPKN